MDEMAAMLENYAGGLQQSFASVFERVGQSLSQSAQVMQMMNDVMEGALLQSLVVSSKYDGRDQLLVSVENRSQILVTQATLSVKLRDAETSFFSAAIESLGVGERHEFQASLQNAVAPISGVIELAFASPGTHQPLSKQTDFRLLFFQQGQFEPVRNEGVRGVSETSAVSDKVALERVREVLQLSPLDGVMTADVGRYRFVQYDQQNDGVVFYLAVKRGETVGSFQVEVSAAGNAEGLQSRCEQIIHELEDLSQVDDQNAVESMEQ